jgi:hypothetical protein
MPNGPPNVFKSHSPKNPPTAPNGTLRMITKGYSHDSNKAAITRYVMTSANSKFHFIESQATRSLSAAPESVMA